MDIGIGLPNPVPGTSGGALLEWARRAEDRGFAGLATIDRIAYPSYDSLIALTAAAAVTERIRLFSNIILAPTRNPVLLAKEAASLDQISGGRLTLGLGVGGREDDFTAAGQGFHDRGRRFDGDLEVMHRAWRGEPVEGALKPTTPTPNDRRVPIMIGGMSDQAVRRTVEWGIGWTVGGAPADQGAAFAERVRAAWKEAGREGSPRLACLSYFGLGDGALDAAKAYLGDYYGDFGLQFAEWIPKTPEALKETVQAYADAGFDEMYLDPVIADPSQVDLAADAVL